MSKRVKTKDHNKRDYRWFNNSEDKNNADNNIDAKMLSGFLEHLQGSGGEGIDKVVLLGDIFDNWVCPYDEQPPTFPEIIEALMADKNTAPVIKNLQGLATKIKTYYLPGNHDMLITKDVINKYFPLMKWGWNPQSLYEYRDDYIFAAHGNSYAVFNARDEKHNPIDGLPLGYYISRVAASVVSRDGDMSKNIFHYLENLSRAIAGRETLPHEVFHTVVEEVEGLKLRDEVILVDGSTITIGGIFDRYDSLYRDWKEGRTFIETSNALYAETGTTELFGGLGSFAYDMTRTDATAVVVFGHSHDAELLQDEGIFEGDDRGAIYANSGAWCSSCEKLEKVYTFVKVEHNPDEAIVSLIRWDPSRNDKVFVYDVKRYPKPSGGIYGALGPKKDN